jgi:hypothetical protein
MLHLISQRNLTTLTQNFFWALARNAANPFSQVSEEIDAELNKLLQKLE